MNLIELLPDFYKNSPEMCELQRVISNELGTISKAESDCISQLDINTATWGLDFWESVYGIKKDVSKSNEYRRTAIIAKMRGAGTTTVSMIKNVASSFSGATVEVEEKPEKAMFDVKFTGTFGIPPNMDDLTAAIENIKPAHLAYNYVFVYRTHANVSQYTHEQLKKYSHEDIRGGKMQ